MSTPKYDNPLGTRYASAEMIAIWSDHRKHSTWRRLWVALAEAQRELGVDISGEQIAELAASVDDIDFERARHFERELRHDVMAHVHTFGEQCPSARGIIHNGATSCFVTDNSELILIREALERIQGGLVRVIDSLATFASEYRDQPILGLTHLQPAQPTTVGKRACLWCYDLILDLDEIEHRLRSLRFRGVKGTTGTQATFLQMFGGDHDKVRQLDLLVAQKLGFATTYPVTGQTYSRKVDAQVLAALSGIAQSAHKAGNDLRILQHRKEIEEPFEKKQIGSSAMAYKRNPMRSERMCALGRFLMSLGANADQTMAVQWMERTLDDSANRRLTIPQAFLAADAILVLYLNITRGLVVYPKVIERFLNEELPFLATEEILTQAVKGGADRQDVHERIRVHSQEAAAQVKRHGKPNDLITRLGDDPVFAGVDLHSTLDPRRFVGRSAEQVDEFVEQYVGPIRENWATHLSRAGDDDVRV